MRRMADSVTVASLPPGLDLYAGYIDGRYINYAQVRARFPGKTVIAIAVSAADNEGDCLDVEQGDATPAQAVGWVQRRRAAGHSGPLVYCSESVWPSVRAAFSVQGVPAPGYWVAGYPGAEGDAIPQGAIGHQWIDHGGWDESVMADYLPGIDPEPPNPIEPTKEQAMQAIVVNGEVKVYAANPANHLMEFTKTPTGWSVDDVTADIASHNPGTPPFLVQP